MRRQVWPVVVLKNMATHIHARDAGAPHATELKMRTKISLELGKSFLNANVNMDRGNRFNC